MKACKGCGELKVDRAGSYCSPACKQKAYRRRKKEAAVKRSDRVSQLLIKEIGMDNACYVFEQLNKVYGEKLIEAVDLAVLGIIDGYRIRMSKEAS